MPYIKSKDRERINKNLEPLIAELKSYRNSGTVVYTVYRIIKSIYGDGDFESKSNALKVLESAKLEYYRRIISPYEDIKIQENGDI